MNNKHTDATIRSACPKHHPVNTKQCCDNGGTYCTCVFQDTIDLNKTPYDNLGGKNGYSSSATKGKCGSREAAKENLPELFLEHPEAFNEHGELDLFTEVGK